MPKLIKRKRIIEDPWTLLPATTRPEQVPPLGPVIVPLGWWLQAREVWRARGEIGVWLAPAENPGHLTADVEALPVIAIEFPTFGDGRGYSTARLLRERYGFTGELRAFGDVFRDQMFFLAECGFDAFAVRADLDPEKEIAGLELFDRVYARSARSVQPWFAQREHFVAALAAPRQSSR